MTAAGCFLLGLLIGPVLAAATDVVPVAGGADALRAGVVRRVRRTHRTGPLALRFPILEIVTGLLFAAVGLRLGPTWTLAPELALVAGLVPLAVIDVRCLRLPVRLVYPTLAAVAVGVGLAGAVEGSGRRLVVAGASAAGWGLLYLGVNLVNPRWLGFGDVRLVVVLGLGLGWLGIADTLLAFVVANTLSAVVGLALVAAGRLRAGAPLPFGLFLAGGSIIALVLGPTLLAITVPA